MSWGPFWGGEQRPQEAQRFSPRLEKLKTQRAASHPLTASCSQLGGQRGRGQRGAGRCRHGGGSGGAQTERRGPKRSPKVATAAPTPRCPQRRRGARGGCRPPWKWVGLRGAADALRERRRLRRHLRGPGGSGGGRAQPHNCSPPSPISPSSPAPQLHHLRAHNSIVASPIMHTSPSPTTASPPAPQLHHPQPHKSITFGPTTPSLPVP